MTITSKKVKMTPKLMPKNDNYFKSEDKFKILHKNSKFFKTSNLIKIFKTSNYFINNSHFFKKYQISKASKFKGIKRPYDI